MTKTNLVHSHWTLLEQLLLNLKTVVNSVHLIYN